MRTLLRALGFVLSIVSSLAHAQGSGWTAGKFNDGSGMYAATVNDSGGVFGQYCFSSDKTCVWLLAVDIACKEGDSYPVLVNSDSGSSSLQLICFMVGTASRMAFKDFDAIDGIVRKSKMIGMAFPMASGLFNVSRFRLDGAPAVIDGMRSVMMMIPDPAKNPPKSQGTRDVSL